MFLLEMEVRMHEWPYADFNYLNLEHLGALPRQQDLAQKWEYLAVELVLPAPSSHSVMFFDHYAGEYKSQRSELSEYLDKLSSDGWKLTSAGALLKGKAFLFRRIQFRRRLDPST
jgi:hypothetical protein